MAERPHTMLQKILSPTATKRREAFDQLAGWPRDEKERFIAYIRNLPPTLAMELCNILPQTTAPDLVETLAVYAARPEAPLRKHACKTLKLLSAQAILPLLPALIKAPEADTRIEACRQIRELGDKRLGLELIHLFKDNDPTVIFAALGAIEAIPLKQALTEIKKLFSHANPTVRAAAIEATAKRAKGSDFPDAEILDFITSDSAPAVRQAAIAAWAGQAKNLDASPLIAVINTCPDLHVRQSAIDALTHFPQEESITALIKLAASPQQAALNLQAKRILGRFPQQLILDVCSDKLQNDDAGIRMEAACLLGNLSTPEAGEILSDQLTLEEDPVVQAAIIEAMGEGGWQQYWDQIIALIDQDPLIAYSGICALCNLLNSHNLHQFTALIQSLDDDILCEAALKRLNLYGKSRGLPEEVSELIGPLLTSEHPNIAVLAAETVGLVKNRTLSEELLNAMEYSDDESFVQSAVFSLLPLYDNDLYTLVCALDGHHYQAITTVIAHLPNLYGKGIELCRLLARDTAENAPNAVEALNAAASLEPNSLVAALKQANTKTIHPLLHAWQYVSESQGAHFPIEWDVLLKSPEQGVRLTALEHIDHEGINQILALLTDLTQIDEDESVRSAAVTAIRRLFTPLQTGGFRAQ